MKLSSHLKDKLSQAYYTTTSLNAFSTPYKLWQAVKKKEPKITLAQVRYWFTTQEIPSRFQQAKKKFP